MRVADNKEINALDHVAETLVAVHRRAGVNAAACAVRHRDAVILSRFRLSALALVVRADADLQKRRVWSVNVLDVQFTRNIIGRIIVRVLQTAPLMVAARHTQNLVFDRHKIFYHALFLLARTYRVIPRRTNRRARIVVDQVSGKDRVCVLLRFQHIAEARPLFFLMADRAEMHVRNRIDFHRAVKPSADDFKIVLHAFASFRQKMAPRRWYLVARPYHRRGAVKV